MKARNLFLFLAAGTLLVAHLVPGAVADEAPKTPVDPAATDAAAEPAAEAVKAGTPSEEAESRISSIRRNEYFYQSYGRKDLCAALVTGEFKPIRDPEIVDVNTATLVGIMWGATDRFALVEDGWGNGFILRVGDKVRNGRVVAVQENSLVAQVTLYGITSRVVLRLEDREGK